MLVTNNIITMVTKLFIIIGTNSRSKYNNINDLFDIAEHNYAGLTLYIRLHTVEESWQYKHFFAI